MAGRGPQSFKKRQKEQQRKEWQEEKRAKINFRKQMADRLGVGLNALRIRTYRIRTRLEECLIKCLAEATLD